MRPPSLEPSTPDVREPRAWVTLTRVTCLTTLSPTLCLLGSGRKRLPVVEGREDRLDRCFVAQPSGVQDQVVVGRQVPVVAVDLFDISGPVLVGVLDPAPRLVFGEIESRHHDLDPNRFRGAKKNVEGGAYILRDFE